MHNITYIYLLSLAFIFREPFPVLGYGKPPYDWHSPEWSNCETRFTAKGGGVTLWIRYYQLA